MKKGENRFADSDARFGDIFSQPSIAMAFPPAFSTTDPCDALVSVAVRKQEKKLAGNSRENPLTLFRP